MASVPQARLVVDAHGLQLASHRGREEAGDGDGVDALDAPGHLLPLGHPAVHRVDQRNHAVEIGAGAVEHLVAVVFQLQISEIYGA